MLDIYLKYTSIKKYLTHKYIRYIKSIILLKNSWKLARLLAGEIEKLLGLLLGTLARQVEKLVRLWRVDTFIGMLEREHVGTQATLARMKYGLANSTKHCKKQL